MSRVASTRRSRFVYRSCLDFLELQREFVEESKIISRTQLDAFIRGCVCSGYGQEIIDAHLKGLEQNDIDWARLCPNLPRRFYHSLADGNFRLVTAQVKDLVWSQNRDICKIVMGLQDGHNIEACLMRYRSDNVTSGHVQIGETSSSTKPRATVCVSSQVGCRMACSFCATGTMGMKANLTLAEILEQIVIANAVERDIQGQPRANPSLWVRNVVFMGMGEPLDNYAEVVGAVRLLTSQHVLAMAPSRVTLSTVGFSIERIESLIEDIPYVSLALSLHAPTQELRTKLVPSARNVDLHKLMDAAYKFVENQKKLSRTSAKRQALLIEYCLIANVNDMMDCAASLAALVQAHAQDTLINLIPYNPTAVRAHCETPSDEAVENFAQTLRSNGLRVLVRHEFGRDINGACGQLALSKRSKQDISIECLVPQSPPVPKLLSPGSPGVSQSDTSQQRVPSNAAKLVARVLSSVQSDFTSTLAIAAVAFLSGVVIGRFGFQKARR